MHHYYTKIHIIVIYHCYNNVNGMVSTKTLIIDHFWRRETQYAAEKRSFQKKCVAAMGSVILIRLIQMLLLATINVCDICA